MLYISISGQNLSIKSIVGSQNEKQDKDRILNNLKGIQKIPIRSKTGDFRYWEVPKSSLGKIYEVWDKSEILVDDKAKQLIEEHNFRSVPLKDLMNEDVNIEPVDTEYQYNDVQLEFASIDYNKKNLALFLDAGAGKTLAILARLANMGFKRLLVLSILDNFTDWSRHIRIVFGDSKKTVIYDGAAAKRKKLDVDSADIVISNYEKLKEVKDMNFDAVVFDECQNTNNPGTKSFKLAKILMGRRTVQTKILSSATPFEASLAPLWGTLMLLDPQLAGTKDSFLAEYEEVLAYRDVPYTRGDRELTFKVPIKTRTKNIPKLQALLSSIMYRKDVSHNMKFEDRTDVIHMDITERQQKLYDQIVEEIIDELNHKTFYSDNPMQKTLRLLQACDGMYNFDPENQESAKLEYIKGVLDSGPKKCIIWSRFRAITDILGKLYPEGVVYNGGVSKKDKIFAKYLFQGCRDKTEEAEFYSYSQSEGRKPGESPWLFITIARTTGAGMNLPSCDNQIVAAAGESARNVKQALSRIKRFDSPHEIINTKILVTRNTIEPEHVAKTLGKIRKAAGILDGKDTILNVKLSEIINLVRNPNYDSEDIFS